MLRPSTYLLAIKKIAKALSPETAFTDEFNVLNLKEHTVTNAYKFPYLGYYSVNSEALVIGTCIE